MSDTPTSRLAINQLSVDALDTMLEGIRARRLVRVQKLEEIAKVKADEVRLQNYLRFEKEYARIKKLMDKQMAEEAKIESALHKLRVLVMEMEMVQ